MNLLLPLLLSFCISDYSTSDASGVINNNPDYGYEVFLHPYVFRSGITTDAAGIVVCDYRGNRILRVSDRGQAETIVEDVTTPVDVEWVDGSYWILLSEPRVLLSWNTDTKERKVLYNEFDADANLTAFAVYSPDTVYVVDFNGSVDRVDLKNRTKTIAQSDLNYPADIALLPGGGWAVTEQVGGDGAGGQVRFMLPDGQMHLYHFIDPTGLAVGPDGSVYVTVFYIDPDSPTTGPPPKDDTGQTEPDPAKPYSGGIYRIRKVGMEPERVCWSLTGPTSLVVLPDQAMAVIEESANVISRVEANGTVKPLFQGSLYPLAVRTFLDGTIAYLTSNSSAYEVILVRANADETRIWSSASQNGLVPLVEMGGDGLLYLFDPLFAEVLVFDSSGTLINSYPVSVDLNQKLMVMADPLGGIALVVWNPEGLVVQKVNRAEAEEPVEYKGMYSPLLYFDEKGNLRDMGMENAGNGPFPPDGQIATDNKGEIWYTDPGNGDLYILKDNQSVLVAEGLGTIKDLSLDGNGGVNVTTVDGRVYHLYPQTSVSNWTIY